MEVKQINRHEIFGDRFKRFKGAIQKYRTDNLREIEEKSRQEEEYEVGKIKDEAKLKDDEYFHRFDKDLQTSQKIFKSRKTNEARMSKMRSRFQMVERIEEEAKHALIDRSKNATFYRSLLKSLITQGLIKLMEEKIEIRCLQKDLQVVKQVAKECQTDFCTQLEMETVIIINNHQFLEQKDIGGVILSSLSGKIVCDNTLRARLSYVMQQMLPNIRQVLFKDSDEFFADKSRKVKAVV